jgi:hypothetical protein
MKDGIEKQRRRGLCLPDMLERLINGALFRLALMLLEIGLKLLFGLLGVNHKFPSRTEG